MAAQVKYISVTSQILSILQNDTDTFFAVKFINRLKSTSLFLTVYSFLQQFNSISAGGIQTLNVSSSLLSQIFGLSVFTLETYTLAQNKVDTLSERLHDGVENILLVIFLPKLQ